jgi:hypothetical protein
LPELREQRLVSDDAFQVFAWTRGGRESAVTTESMNAQRLYWEDFGFAPLRSKRSAFQKRGGELVGLRSKRGHKTETLSYCSGKRRNCGRQHGVRGDLARFTEEVAKIREEQAKSEGEKAHPVQGRGSGCQTGRRWLLAWKIVFEERKRDFG